MVGIGQSIHRVQTSTNTSARVQALIQYVDKQNVARPAQESAKIQYEHWNSVSTVQGK